MSVTALRHRSSAAALDPRAWLAAASLDGNTPLSIRGSRLVADEAPKGVDAQAQQDALATAVLEFCRGSPELLAVLGDPTRATPISGGLTNCSFKVDGSKGTIFVKKAEDHHMLATAIPMSVARLATEAHSMRLAHAVLPTVVPACLHYGPDANMLAAEFIEGRETLAAALLRGAIYPGLAARLGAAHGAIAARVSRQAVGAKAWAALGAVSDASANVADMMEDHVLYLPFDRAAPHNSWPAGLDALVESRVHGNAALMSEVAALRALRRDPGAAACLLHTDAWLGNLLVPTWDGAKSAAPSEGAEALIIDWEFGVTGPNSYDIGHTLGMLALGAILTRAYDEAGVPANDDGDGSDGAPLVPPKQRARQEEWLVSSIEELWAGFERGWRGAKPKGISAAWRRAPPAPELADVLGYAGCAIIRWSIGQFNIFKNLGVDEGTPAHEAAVRRAVDAGAALLARRREVKGAAEAAEFVRDVLRA